jgi:CRP-like cAMP-binding protein
MRRDFTVMALTNCEMVTLDIKYFPKFSAEHPEIYEELRYRELSIYNKTVRIKNFAKRSSVMSKFKTSVRPTAGLTKGATVLERALNNNQCLKKVYKLTEIIEEDSDDDSISASYVSENEGIEDSLINPPDTPAEYDDDDEQEQ